jgi:ATP-binding cassette subfamily F protein 3
MSIQLSNVTKNFASRTVWSGLTMSIGAKSRIGLIGRNGCGKSTLLKLIMGLFEPDEGAVYRAPGLRVNYLSQEPRITPHLTLAEEMQTVFVELNTLEKEEAELLEKLNHPLPPGPESDELQMNWAIRLSEIHTAQERLGAGDAEARTGRILKGLGFSLADHDRKTGEFSGGWKMRINLAKVLLEGADVILMDEPTNHLDLEACEWLESFLKEYPGGLVIVSHDRRFLDQTTTETAELELGGLKVWPGNYSKTAELKEAERAIQIAAAERQVKELSKQQAFVDRFKASATRGTQAKSREKQLAKIERIEAPVEDHRKMTFSFPAPEASGKEVMTLRHVKKGFENKPLFDDLNADLERRQRVFLLGQNGTGKTTLLRLILGLEKIDAGQIKTGHNVKLGYFSQNQLDTLDPKISVLETVQLVCPLMQNAEIRGMLGRFLFTGDQVFKPVSVLSGGEKSKVALAKLMLSGPNTLLLDEPTNHMDIPSKEVMAKALLEYEGSMLCISHDRYFIQELATHIWELYRGRLLVYAGDYDYYLYKREEMRADVDRDIEAAERARLKKNPAPATKEKPPIVTPLQERSDLEKQLKKVERQVLVLETEISELQSAMAGPDIQQDYEKLYTLAQRLENRQAELARENAHWAEIAEKLSSSNFL